MGIPNKVDEFDIVVRNKAKLIVQGCFQEEIIDFDKNYAPIARLKAIRILLTHACH